MSRNDKLDVSIETKLLTFCDREADIAARHSHEEETTERRAYWRGRLSAWDELFKVLTSEEEE